MYGSHSEVGQNRVAEDFATAACWFETNPKQRYVWPTNRALRSVSHGRWIPLLNAPSVAR